MTDNRGTQFAGPESYPYYSPQIPPWQQQPWGGQMGTRGAGGAQGQPPSPGEVQGGFQGQQPGGGFQGQMGPQPGLGMPEQVPVNLSPQEKVALRGALDILKEGRAALASGSLEGPVAQRLTAAHAYVSGFVEARGLAELGGYLSTIPQVSTRGSAIDDPEYDQMLDQFDGFLADESQTRLPWAALVKSGPKIGPIRCFRAPCDGGGRRRRGW